MTDPSGYLDHVAAILEQAAGLSGDARAAYLREACGGDDALRAEVDSMLAAKDEQEDFLAEPTCAPTMDPDDATAASTSECSAPRLRKVCPGRWPFVSASVLNCMSVVILP